MALPISYNVRNVFQRPVSTAATALGVGLTVAILIGALALASGFQKALSETGSPDNVIVLRKGAHSEISSGNKVLMPVFRGDVFQSVTFRMNDPKRFDAIKAQLEGDPRLGVEVRRESSFYASQSELLANVIRIAGVFIVLIMAVGAIF